MPCRLGSSHQHGRLLRLQLSCREAAAAAVMSQGGMSSMTGTGCNIGAVRARRAQVHGGMDMTGTGRNIGAARGRRARMHGDMSMTGTSRNIGAARMGGEMRPLVLSSVVLYCSQLLVSLVSCPDLGWGMAQATHDLHHGKVAGYRRSYNN